MLSIIICSHANLALGIRTSAEMIIGKQSNLYSFGFEEGDDFFEFKDKLHEAIKHEIEIGNQVCCLTDLPNATPFNCCVLALSEFEVDSKILSGVSLPMILELLIQRNIAEDYDELINNSMEAAKNGLSITSVKEFIAQEER